MTAKGTAEDENSIRATLARYCRAVDRCDKEAFLKCFWEGAKVNYGAYKGLASDFVEPLLESLKDWEQTHHQLGQSLVDWRGPGHAMVETYVTAWHLPNEPRGREMTYLGRYYDRFENTGGVWKIADRRIVMGWTRYSARTHNADDDSVAGLINSARKPDDVIYRGK